MGYTMLMTTRYLLMRLLENTVGGQCSSNAAGKRRGHQEV